MIASTSVHRLVRYHTYCAASLEFSQLILQQLPILHREPLLPHGMKDGRTTIIK